MSEEDKDAKLEATGVLNEGDADSLLSEAKKDSLPGNKRRSVVISPEGIRLGSDQKVSSQRHDFINSASMSDGEVERLRRMHKEMISTLEAQVSLFLRSEVSMTFTSLEIIEYGKVIQKLEKPTHLALFRADPLPGIGFLEISPRLALSTVNKVLGGIGKPLKEERHLTKIETDLIEEFILILIQDWLGQWRYETTPVPSIVGHEVVPSTLQICEPNTSMLQFTLDVTIRESSGRIQVVVPLFMIEPMVRHLESQRLTKVEPTTPTRLPSWQQRYGDVPLSAEVTVSAGPMKVREFKNLKVGDTITLPEGCMEQAILRLERKPLFEGKFGVDNGKMALCIQSKLQS
ncbi:MAG: FliM/FliN family flagellar motor switch protein [Verrucomicrobia bacterium]|nr:FliM/FliN family flagellar motor switch protein [Verrucomicrobiota bacterium]